jgi:HNH endonuclease
MAITLKRQIDEDEKKRVLEIHGRKCFATGHEILEENAVHFDHIKAFSDDGPTSIDNIAPMCEMHNKQKGRLPLYDFRIRLHIDEFFGTGKSLTLKNQLAFLKKKSLIKDFGSPVNLIQKNTTEIEIEVENKKRTFPLFLCPITKWEYFFASLPVSILDSDDDEKHEVGLQPRYLIADKVFNLFRHFQRHPVLQPSICRLHKGKILVFDGQHKIASLLWGGTDSFECKVYIKVEPKLLNETNISAHDKFAQTRFYSSIMVAKLGSQFGKEFEDYKALEDDGLKTESGFISFLKNKDFLTKGELNKRFRSFLYNSVLDESKNKMVRLVSKGNRGSSEQPITMDMLQKSLFTSFLYQDPAEDDMASEYYRREAEINNLIFLFNKLYELSLVNWDGNKPNSDPQQRKLDRMYRSKSIMSWAELLRDSIAGKLGLNDEEDRQKPFYRDLSDDQIHGIEYILKRLVDWHMWDSPENSEIDRILSDNKSVVKNFLREKGLTTGYLMGAPE